MVEANIAKRLEGSDKICNGRYKNLVTQEERFRKIIDTVLTHPQNLIFADEKRCNASLKNDGYVAGTRFITKKGTVPQQMASTKDYWFTLLPFTLATGDAICCVVIFKSEKIELEFGVKMAIDV